MEGIKQIEQLNKWVQKYYNTPLEDGEALNLCLQKITALLYYLETLRSEVHSQWQAKVYDLTKEGESVARSENTAHVDIPQMYQLRHIMTAGYRIADAIRTHISYLKQEKLNSNNSN